MRSLVEGEETPESEERADLFEAHADGTSLRAPRWDASGDTVGGHGCGVGVVVCWTPTTQRRRDLLETHTGGVHFGFFGGLCVWMPQRENTVLL